MNITILSTLPGPVEAEGTMCIIIRYVLYLYTSCNIRTYVYARAVKFMNLYGCIPSDDILAK